MMDCSICRELLAADFADDETTPFRANEIVKHLESCPACLAFSKELNERAIEPIRDFAKLTPPDDLWRSIKSELTSSGAF